MTAQTNHLAFIDRNRDPLECVDIAVVGIDIGKFEQCHLLASLDRAGFAGSGGSFGARFAQIGFDHHRIPLHVHR